MVTCHPPFKGTRQLGNRRGIGDNVQYFFEKVIYKKIRWHFLLLIEIHNLVSLLLCN